MMAHCKQDEGATTYSVLSQPCGAKWLHCVAVSECFLIIIADINSVYSTTFVGGGADASDYWNRTGCQLLLLPCRHM